MCLVSLTCNYAVSLFGEVSSSSECLGWAALFLWLSLGLLYNYFTCNAAARWSCKFSAQPQNTEYPDRGRAAFVRISTVTVVVRFAAVL